jgi:hypothetical protein
MLAIREKSLVESIRGVIGSYNKLEPLIKGFPGLLARYPAFDRIEHVEKYGKDARNPHVMTDTLLDDVGSMLVDEVSESSIEVRVAVVLSVEESERHVHHVGVSGVLAVLLDVLSPLDSVS